jgi:hypothetical protein
METMQTQIKTARFRSKGSGERGNYLQKKRPPSPSVSHVLWKKTGPSSQSLDRVSPSWLHRRSSPSTLVECINADCVAAPGVLDRRPWCHLASPLVSPRVSPRVPSRRLLKVPTEAEGKRAESRMQKAEGINAPLNSACYYYILGWICTWKAAQNVCDVFCAIVLV